MTRTVRVGFTGSRHWDDPLLCLEQDLASIARIVLQTRVPTVLVVGDCPTGVDDRVLRFLEPKSPPPGLSLWEKAVHQGLLSVEVHYADWTRWGVAAGPIRNRGMVDSGLDLLCAYPRAASKGTRGCMELAREAGVPVFVTEWSNIPRRMDLDSRGRPVLTWMTLGSRLLYHRALDARPELVPWVEHGDPG